MKRAYLFFMLAVFIMAISNAAEEVSLVNPDFEADNQEPWYWWGDAGTGTYGVSESSHDGKKSIKIVADKGDYIPMGFLQDFDCSPEEEVTVSAWVMSPTSSPLTNSDAYVRLEFWGGEPFNIIKSYESPHVTGAFNWTNSTISAKAPEGTTKAKIGLFIWNPGTGHSGSVYFDDAKASKKGPVLF